MSEREPEVESGEESIDEQGRNPTQRELDGDEPGPATTTGGGTADWDETNDEPHQGEAGQDLV
jgi:hypothetical protein